MKNKIIKEYNPKTSRKWTLVVMIFIAGICIFTIPPILTALLHLNPLILLSGSEFVSLMVLVSGIYSGANVFQKRIERDVSNGLDMLENKIPALKQKAVDKVQTEEKAEEKTEEHIEQIKE